MNALALFFIFVMMKVMSQIIKKKHKVSDNVAKKASFILATVCEILLKKEHDISSRPTVKVELKKRPDCQVPH